MTLRLRGVSFLALLVGPFAGFELKTGGVHRECTAIFCGLKALFFPFSLALSNGLGAGTHPTRAKHADGDRTGHRCDAAPRCA